MKTKLVAFSLCFLLQNSFAQDVRGTPDCATWLRPDSSTRELVDKSWLVGYLSGLNLGFSLDKRRKPFNYFEGVTTGQIFLWMDNYCRASPLSNVMLGTGDLFLEMSKK